MSENISTEQAEPLPKLSGEGFNFAIGAAEIGDWELDLKIGTP